MRVGEIHEWLAYSLRFGANSLDLFLRGQEGGHPNTTIYIDPSTNITQIGDILALFQDDQTHFLGGANSYETSLLHNKIASLLPSNRQSRQILNNSHASITSSNRPKIFSTSTTLLEFEEEEKILLDIHSAVKYLWRMVCVAFQVRDRTVFIRPSGFSEANEEDWVVITESEELYPVSRGEFEEFFSPLSNEESNFQYEKQTPVLARKMDSPFKACRGDETTSGSPGDYLVQDEKGEQWVFDDDEFSTQFRIDPRQEEDEDEFEKLSQLTTRTSGSSSITSSRSSSTSPTRKAMSMNISGGRMGRLSGPDDRKKRPSSSNPPPESKYLTSDNSDCFERRNVIFAFRSEYPIACKKGYGWENGNDGDWLVCLVDESFGEIKLSIVPDDEFTKRYELLDQAIVRQSDIHYNHHGTLGVIVEGDQDEFGRMEMSLPTQLNPFLNMQSEILAMHVYREKGRVLATRMDMPFVAVRKGGQKHKGEAGDFLVQSEFGDQYVSSPQDFLQEFKIIVPDPSTDTLSISKQSSTSSNASSSHAESNRVKRMSMRRQKPLRLRTAQQSELVKQGTILGQLTLPTEAPRSDTLCWYGSLMKRSRHLKMWRRRYFFLYPSKLVYTRSPVAPPSVSPTNEEDKELFVDSTQTGISNTPLNQPQRRKSGILSGGSGDGPQEYTIPLACCDIQSMELGSKTVIAILSSEIAGFIDEDMMVEDHKSEDTIDVEDTISNEKSSGSTGREHLPGSSNKKRNLFGKKTLPRSTSTFSDIEPAFYLEPSSERQLNMLLVLFKNAVVSCNKAKLHDVCVEGLLTGFISVRKAVRGEVDREVVFNSVDSEGLRPLHLASKHAPTCLRELLKMDHIDVNSKSEDGKGQTSLHIAVVASQLECVEMLMGSGADVNAVDALGRTPLHFSSTRDITAFLTANGANVDVQDNSGHTPLMEMVKRGNRPPIQELFIQSPDVNARAWKTGCTALHYAIDGLARGTVGDELLIGLLLHHGADLSLVNLQLNTALHAAALGFKITTHQFRTHYIPSSASFRETVENLTNLLSLYSRVMTILLEKSVREVEVGNSEGLTPFSIICQSLPPLLDNRQSVELFHLEDVGENGSDLFESSSINHILSILNPPPAAASVISDISGATPLHLSAMIGNYEAIGFLLSCPNVDVNSRDQKGFTPLDYLIQYSPINEKDNSSIPQSQNLESAAPRFEESEHLLVEGGALKRINNRVPVETDTDTMKFLRGNDGSYSIRSCTLPALLERMLRDETYDKKDVRTLLLCYIDFVTDGRLVSEVERVFSEKIKNDDERGGRRAVLHFMNEYISTVFLVPEHEISTSHNTHHHGSYERKEGEEEDESPTLFEERGHVGMAGEEPREWRGLYRCDSEFWSSLCRLGRELVEGGDPDTFPADFLGVYSCISDIEDYEERGLELMALFVMDSVSGSTAMNLSRTLSSKMASLVSEGSSRDLSSRSLKSNNPSFSNTSKKVRDVMERVRSETKSVMKVGRILGNDMGGPDFSQLIQLRPIDIARQITLAQHYYFKLIPNEEFLSRKYSDIDICPNLNLLREWNLTTTRFFLNAILLPQSPGDRISIMCLLVQVAEECLKVMNNFDGAVLIQQVMESCPIFRLKSTWAKVEKRLPGVWKSVKDELGIGARKILPAMLESSVPAMPYVGLILASLVHNHEVPSTSGEHINFVKYSKVVELLEVVERMQSTPFMIEVDITSQRMFQVLNGSFISSERDFDQRSKELEGGGQGRGRRTSLTWLGLGF